MRREGWEVILHEHIRQAHDAVFQWGTLDCALWCGDWIEKATGDDLVSAWRGRYAAEAELRELMAAKGLASFEEIADGAGYQVVGVPFAQRGDVVLNPQGCLGVSEGLLSHFLMEAGVLRLPTLKCKKAWKVG